MTAYFLENEIKVLARQVKSFPEGIGDAFNGIMKLLNDENMTSSYFGISSINEDKILYYAAAKKMNEKEFEQFKENGFVEFTVEKGNYLVETLKDWRNNLMCIKDIFQDLMNDERSDKNTNCVEWYKTNDEMWCMIKMK